MGTDAPSRPRFIPPPTAKLDCYPAAIAGDNKFILYCEILAKMVQNHGSVRLIDAPLAKKGSHEGADAHWNSCRKNKFIVVERRKTLCRMQRESRLWRQKVLLIY